jgi:hypothetical protein
MKIAISNVVLLDISAKRQPVNGEFINDYDDMCMS